MSKRFINFFKIFFTAKRKFTRYVRMEVLAGACGTLTYSKKVFFILRKVRGREHTPLQPVCSRDTYPSPHIASSQKREAPLLHRYDMISSNSRKTPLGMSARKGIIFILLVHISLPYWRSYIQKKWKLSHMN